MSEKDFQLEELENAAVNKSNNAKRIAAAAGIAALGGGTALAAKAAADSMNHPTEEIEALTEEDLQNVAETGSEQVPEAQSVVKQEVVIENDPQPETPTEDQANIEFESRTMIVDEDLNVKASVLDGTIDGRNFQLQDLDGDGEADVIKIDADDNGIYTSDETVLLTSNDHISMDQDVHNNTVIIEPNPWDEPTPDPWLVVENDDIENDFLDEKTGEVYENDYAENNENYVNNADDDSNNEMAYENYNEGEEFVSDDFSGDDMIFA